MKQKKASLWTRDFIVVIAATFFTGIVMGILDSCLAPLDKDMFSSKTLGGYLTSLFNLGSIIMAFFSGRFVDLRGRKKMFFVGAIIFAIPTFVCAAFPTPTVSLTTRFIQGLGKAIVGVAGASIVADAVDITAESTAPKKSTRSQSGMWSRTSVGNRRCGSVASMSCALPGITRMAAMTMNIGTNAKRM